MLESDLLGRSVEDRAAPSRVREFRHRRPTWRAGTRVTLGDGAWWWLSPFDRALILTCSRIRRNANTALRLARTLDESADEGEDVLIIRSAVYHAQMIQMGITLLQQNYRLEDASWFELISFPRIDDAFRFSGAVSEVFAAAGKSWFPFLVGDRLVV